MIWEYRKYIYYEKEFMFYKMLESNMNAVQA